MSKDEAKDLVLKYYPNAMAYPSFINGDCAAYTLYTITTRDVVISDTKKREGDAWKNAAKRLEWKPREMTNHTGLATDYIAFEEMNP